MIRYQHTGASRVIAISGDDRQMAALGRSLAHEESILPVDVREAALTVLADDQCMSLDLLEDHEQLSGLLDVVADSEQVHLSVPLPGSVWAEVVGSGLIVLIGVPRTFDVTSERNEPVALTAHLHLAGEAVPTWALLDDDVDLIVQERTVQVVRLIEAIHERRPLKRVLEDTRLCLPTTPAEISLFLSEQDRTGEFDAAAELGWALNRGVFTAEQLTVQSGDEDDAEAAGDHDRR